MTTPTPPTTAESPKKKRRWPWIVGGAVAFLFIVGACSGNADDTTDIDETTTAVATTEQTETAETTTIAEAEPEAENTPQAAPADASERIMPWTRHEMCQPDDGTAQMITGVLNDQSLTVSNGQLIKDGDDTWIGVSLIGADGDVESRSDVWLLRDGGLYSVSGGAKNESWAVDAPGVSMADEYAAGVDRCVVAESMGR